MKIQKSLKPAKQFAEKHGFTVEPTANNHIRYRKPGHKTVYSGSTLSDRRAVRNVISHLTKSLEGRL